MNGFKIVGFILGFIGVVVISINDGFSYILIFGILFGIVSIIIWIFGIIYMKKIFIKVDVIWLIIF